MHIEIRAEPFARRPMAAGDSWTAVPFLLHRVKEELTFCTASQRGVAASGGMQLSHWAAGPPEPSDMLRAARGSLRRELRAAGLGKVSILP